MINIGFLYVEGIGDVFSSPIFDSQIFHNESGFPLEGEHIKFRKNESRILTSAWNELRACLHGPLVAVIPWPSVYPSPCPKQMPSGLLPTSLSRKQIPLCQLCPSS